MTATAEDLATDPDAPKARDKSGALPALSWRPVCIDDVPLGRFHIATVVFQRARQLEGGACARVEAARHKSPRIALMELAADTISWSIGEA